MVIPVTDAFELRGRPRPVKRVRRGLVFGLIFAGVLVIAGLIVLALKPVSFKPTFTELVSTETKPTAPGLEVLPKRYDGLTPLPSSIPKDEAKAVTHPAIKPEIIDPEIARLEKQARGAGVFFALKGQTARDAEKLGAAATSRFDAEGQNPFAFPQSFLGEDPTKLPPGFEAQTAKDRFVKATPDGTTLNPHRLSKPASPYQVLAGTVISASLMTGLNSDLPGFVIAQVTEPVYDTVTGRHLLIPQGTRLLGKYDARVSFGQDRALLVWQRLIRPDGSSIVIDNLPGTDAGGYAGLVDEVNYHEWRLLKGIALATLLNVGTALSANDSDSDLVNALRQASGQTVNRAGQSIVERQLNVQPTLTIRPGWPLRVIVHKDLVLEPYRVR